MQFDTWPVSGCNPSNNFIGVADYNPSSNSYGCTHLVTQGAPVSLRGASHSVVVSVTWGTSPHLFNVKKSSSDLSCEPSPWTLAQRVDVVNIKIVEISGFK